ncbi:MAG: hypothetical protein IJ870_06570 [Alphaproteobacteria bacterium]|nr:hypothetical protein [Alphaproteobacteria bacterium]
MWVLFALMASIVNAIYYIGNQNIRLQPSVFMIYRGIVVALMAFPFLFFYDVIGAWQFYVIAVFQGCITAYNDFTTLKANRKYGAETVNSITPMNVGLIFMIWCLIEPVILLKYLESPIKSIMIVLSMCGIVFALMQYRKVKMTKEAFVYLLPIMFLGAMISIFNKTIMAYAADSLYGLCFWRIFVSSLTVGIIHIVVYATRKRPFKVLFEKENLIRVWIFIFMPISMLCRNMAMFGAENPSYVTSIVQTSLLWIMFFNRYVNFIEFKKVCMKMEKKWAFLMLVSVIVLILATN